ncbi:hypothetical protein JW933_00365 [candidate division FCPU426 bacterium]|nr:hypothetical protein [candidate division FCPU426 bacterium]
MTVEWTKRMWRVSVVILAMAVLAGTMGCGKGKKTKLEGEGTSDMEKKLAEVVKSMEEKKEPYKGNLTPDKAALITHEVSAQSMAEFPTGKNLPKDPQKLISLNERIRKKSDQTYAKHGTTMEEMMRYISGLSPKDREKYNNKLTELFLEQSRKKYGSEGESKAPAPEMPAAPADKK